MADQRDGGISWTDDTWNPIRGCTRVSEGCRNCYAERVAARFSGEGQPYHGLAKRGDAGPRWTGKVQFFSEQLDQPLRRRRPRRIFVNSMSDLFHEGLDDVDIAAIFGVMAAAPQHTFQVLTKRPERMREWFNWIASLCDPPLREIRFQANGYVFGDDSGRLPLGSAWPLPNVWLGVSVEDQAAADERIPMLLTTPAAVRFLSCEPLIGMVQIPDVFMKPLDWGDGPKSWPDNAGLIDWVIAGGESGPGARPVHPDWVRSLRDQCEAAGVPFHFKQWGDWVTEDQSPHDIVLPSTAMGHWGQKGPYAFRVGKKVAGRLLDGRTWDEFPTATTTANERTHA